MSLPWLVDDSWLMGGASRITMDGRHWMHDDGATLHEERESESKEKAHSSLIQTGVSFSLDLQGRQ